MKKTLLSLSLLACAYLQASAQSDTIWIKYNDRFLANGVIKAGQLDSIKFEKGRMVMYRKPGTSALKSFSSSYKNDCVYMFNDPGRILYKPSTWSSNDYTNENSRWSFANSMESEHFVVFWDKQFGSDPTKAGSYAFNPKTMLQNGEKYFDVYANKLGFIKPGESTTDTYKIEMYVYYQTDWKAEGSGVDYKVGLLNVNPWAISSRSGQTVAHEVGHTFQYLVKCDVGEPHGFDYGYGDNASGLNGWWEGCANWQAYKVYPNLQFEQDFYDAYKGQYHLGLMNETFRYQNMFIQDWWCQKHGQDFIGRLWREAKRPEDPIEAYIRLNDMDLEAFNDETYEGFAHMATWDIDGIRQYGKKHIGDYSAQMHEAADDNMYWEVDSAYCPQNYGYNMIPIKLAAAGTKISADFKGIAGADGYRKVKTAKAGWRYGFVAYTSDGQTVYGAMGKDKEGTAELTVPDNCKNIWFCVMGAPTEYWRHPWDSDVSNDEQWPYRVKFTNTDALGLSHTYGEFADDYVRKDTTVVIEANLAYSSSNYTSVRVQYDMDAISQALGLSTAQLKTLKVGKSNKIRFVGVSANGNLTEGTTTSTSSSTVYGHWFTTAGNVCGYDNSAGVFAELYPDKYGCYVGQYPGHLRSGKTYTIRQAIIYTHTDGKEYRATMEVHLNIQ